MRVFLQGTLARNVARLLVMVFALTSVTIGIVPAGAQVPTRSTQATGSVAVVPFQNLTSYNPDKFGDEAAAAVAGELRDRLLIPNVTAAGDVATAMKSLALKPPLTEQELIRLATELETDMVVTGEVRKAEIVVSGGQRYAELQLAVLLFDRASGANVNGAFVTVKSPSSAELSGDDLMRKALQQAAFLAAQEMKTRPTVTAMVLWARGEEIFTNTGTRGGIAAGMQMVAVRGGQRIGLVTMTSADATGSYGKVTEGTQLRTGDRLRAVFTLPEAARPTLSSRAKQGGSGLAAIAVPAAILLGVAGFAGSARHALEGAFIASGLKSANLSNGGELGISGLMSVDVPVPVDDPANPGKFLSTPGVISLPYTYSGASVITWQPFSGTQKTRLAGYLVYRNGYPVDFVFNQENPQTFVVDQFYPPATDTNILGIPILGARVFGFELTIDTVTGIVSQTIMNDVIYGLGDSGATADTTSGVITIGTDVATFEASVAPTNVANTVAITPTVVDGKWLRVGPDAARQARYTVLPITIENDATPGTNIPIWQFSTTTTPSPAQILTSVVPPGGGDVLNGWDQTVTLDGNIDSASNVNVSFYNPPGADEMIVQIARDPGQGQPVRFRSGAVVQAVASSMDPMRPKKGAGTAQLSMTNVRALPGTENIFWLRIGARNRGDQFAALPTPPTAASDATNPLSDEVGWVWWAPGPIQLSRFGTTARPSMKAERATLSATRRTTRATIRTRTGTRDRTVRTN